MKHLNAPLYCNHLTLDNRIVMPPMATGKGTETGHVTEAVCAYYADKTRTGKISLVITEHSFISPEGRAGLDRKQMSVASDDMIPGLRKLADTIHAGSAKAMVQISHSGADARSRITGLPVYAPSAVYLPGSDPAKMDLPQALEEAEIHALAEKFAAAARRVKEAGFDGVEIHAAHRYLLNQFYSPLTNHRTDVYTGSTLQGRTRFLVEVIQAVRKAVGPDFCIAIRFGACDYTEGGSTMQEAAEAAALLEAAGADLLDISGGMTGFRVSELVGEGYFRDLTKAIRERVHVPVILTGGITTGSAAESLIAEGYADLIGVGRALLADSDWPAKALNGDL